MWRRILGEVGDNVDGGNIGSDIGGNQVGNRGIGVEVNVHVDVGIMTYVGVDGRGVTRCVARSATSSMVARSAVTSVVVGDEQGAHVQ